jgi:hypothetical protein
VCIVRGLPEHVRGTQTTASGGDAVHRPESHEKRCQSHRLLPLFTQSSFASDSKCNGFLGRWPNTAIPWAGTADSCGVPISCSELVTSLAQISQAANAPRNRCSELPQRRTNAHDDVTMLIPGPYIVPSCMLALGVFESVALTHGTVRCQRRALRETPLARGLRQLFGFCYSGRPPGSRCVSLRSRPHTGLPPSVDSCDYSGFLFID